MTPSPVGMRCPECASQRTKVTTAAAVRSGGAVEPYVTYAIAAIYFTSLLAGSFGALLLQPNAVTIGASGAVFGLMGAAVVEFRRRGIGFMESGIGILIIINLGFSFLFPGISIGGHIGGLIGG